MQPSDALAHRPRAHRPVGVGPGDRGRARRCGHRRAVAAADPLPGLVGRRRRGAPHRHRAAHVRLAAARARARLVDAAARAGRLRADDRGRRRPPPRAAARGRGRGAAGDDRAAAFPARRRARGGRGDRAVRQPDEHGPAAAHPDLRHLGAPAGHPRGHGDRRAAGTRRRPPCRRSRSCARCPTSGHVPSALPRVPTVRIEITDASLPRDVAVVAVADGKGARRRSRRATRPCG